MRSLMICTAHHRFSGDQIEKNEIGGHVVRMAERISAYRVLVGKPEGKRPLRKPRRRWKDNMKMNLQDVGCGCMVWVYLRYLRLSSSG
jgi:hypothetical protein